AVEEAAGDVDRQLAHGPPEGEGDEAVLLVRRRQVAAQLELAARGDDLDLAADAGGDPLPLRVPAQRDEAPRRGAGARGRGLEQLLELGCELGGAEVRDHGRFFPVSVSSPTRVTSSASATAARTSPSTRSSSATISAVPRAESR